MDHKRGMAHTANETPIDSLYSNRISRRAADIRI
jgi:hypothetical protein